jgi:hypothetical protein
MPFLAGGAITKNKKTKKQKTQMPELPELPERIQQTIRYYK